MPNRIMLTNIIADVIVVFVTDLKISISIKHALVQRFQAGNIVFMAKIGRKVLSQKNTTRAPITLCEI